MPFAVALPWIAILLEPTLRSLAPTVRALVGQSIPEGATQLLDGFGESALHAVAGVSHELMGERIGTILAALEKGPSLDEALIVALRECLKEIHEDIRNNQPHLVLDPFAQFFLDWDAKLKSAQADERERHRVLDTSNFARLFYEPQEANIEKCAWWPLVKSQLREWTTFKNIPLDLEQYIQENLIHCANQALTQTLNSAHYKSIWDLIHKVVETEILSIVKVLELQIQELTTIAQLANGEFIQDGEIIDFPLRAGVDFLVRELSGDQVFIQRDVHIKEGSKKIKVNSVEDLVGRGSYFLLTTPAGSGKSTLMAHWIRHSVETADVSKRPTPAEVCYYFYSKSQGTDDHEKALTILADQLLKAHGIRANVGNSNPARIASLIPQLLALNSSKHLTIVIDGIDEAGTPSTRAEWLGLFKPILPKRPGRNVNIILTVRDDLGVGSFERLETELKLDLVLLTMSEIDENKLISYLKSLDNESLRTKANDDEFVRRIIKKTGGLAIYIRHLLDELTNTAELGWDQKIETLPEAFEAYVTGLLAPELSGLPQWQTALSYISLAQNPLDEADLIALTKMSGTSINNFDFDGVKWPIRRWLKKEAKSWDFSHERIREVFLQRYVQPEKSAYMEHLLAYCADWENNGSRYVLQNYSELLWQQKKRAELYEIASNKNFLDRQREDLKDNPNASLQTLGNAIRCAADTDDSAMMCRFLLERAETVRRMSGESWLDAYYRRGWRGALELADHLGDRVRRVIWYFRIAEKLATSNKNAEAVEVLRQLNCSAFPTLPSQLYFIVDSTFPAFLQTREVDLVKDVGAKTLPETEFTTRFVQASGRYLEKLEDKHFSEVAGLVSEVTDVAHAMASTKTKPHVLVTLGIVCLRGNKPDEAKELFSKALAVAQSVVDSISRRQLLGELAKRLSAANLVEEAATFMVEGEGSFASVNGSEIRSPELANLGTITEQADLPGKSKSPSEVALSVSGVESFKRDGFKPFDSSESEDKEQTIQSAGALNGAGPRDPASLKKFSFYLTNKGDFERAAAVAQSIPRSRFRFFALQHLASSLEEAGKMAQASKFFGEARKAALTSNAIEFHSDDEFDIGQALADAVLLDDYELEEATNESIEETEELDYASSASDSGERRSAQMAVGRIKALDSLAISLTEADHFKEAKVLFDQTEQFARSLHGSRLRSRALCEIATDLAAACLFDKASGIARHIVILRFRLKALGNIATAFQRAGKLTEARNLFAEIRQGLKGSRLDRWSRSHVIRSIGGALNGDYILSSIRKASSMRGASKRSGTLMRLVAALADDPSMLDRAEQVARSIETGKYRSQTLGILAAALVTRNNVVDGQRLFAESEQNAHSLRHFEFRSRALGELAFNFATAGLFDESLRIMEDLNGSDLLATLDEFAKAKIATGLKNHILSLSYDTESALRASAQMIRLWQDHTDAIYSEVNRYVH